MKNSFYKIVTNKSYRLGVFYMFFFVLIFYIVNITLVIEIIYTYVQFICKATDYTQISKINLKLFLIHVNWNYLSLNPHFIENKLASNT